MDYFEHVDLHEWASSDEFLNAHGSDELFLFTGQAKRIFSDIDFAQVAERGQIMLCFGRESAGIDPDILARFETRCVRIPMEPDRRSLNLANSVAIGLYETLRQLGYPALV